MTGTVELSEAELRSAGENPDLLTPTQSVSIAVGPALAGDFNIDGVVDVFDFFLFVDHFNSTDPFYDLDGSGAVDFLDLFIFVDNFGRSISDPPAKEIADFSSYLFEHRLRPNEPSQAILVSANMQAQDTLQVDLLWVGDENLRGFAVNLSFDPEQLGFLDFLPAPSESPPLHLTKQLAPGRLTLAASAPPTRNGFRGDGLGSLRFHRRLRSAAEIYTEGVVAYDGDRLEYPALPEPVRIRALAAEFALYPVHPNPFNPETTIRIYLPTETRVGSRIYDILGRAVAVLADDGHAPGYHQYKWAGLDDHSLPVATGVYFLELRTEAGRRVEKLLLLK